MTTSDIALENDLDLVKTRYEQLELKAEDLEDEPLCSFVRKIAFFATGYQNRELLNWLKQKMKFNEDNFLRNIFIHTQKIAELLCFGTFYETNFHAYSLETINHYISRLNSTLKSQLYKDARFYGFVEKMEGKSHKSNLSKEERIANRKQRIANRKHFFLSLRFAGLQDLNTFLETCKQDEKLFSYTCDFYLDIDFDDNDKEDDDVQRLPAKKTTKGKKKRASSNAFK